MYFSYSAYLLKKIAGRSYVDSHYKLSIVMQERTKERQLKEEMETEMREKDRQVNELLIHRKQVTA